MKKVLLALVRKIIMRTSSVIAFVGLTFVSLCGSSGAETAYVYTFEKPLGCPNCRRMAQRQLEERKRTNATEFVELKSDTSLRGPFTHFITEVFTDSRDNFTIDVASANPIVIRGYGLDTVDVVQLERFEGKEVVDVAPLSILDKKQDKILAVLNPISEDMDAWTKGNARLNAKPYGMLVDVKLVGEK